MDPKEFESLKNELLDIAGVSENEWGSILSDSEERELVRAHKNNDSQKKDALLSVVFYRDQKMVNNYFETEYRKNLTHLLKQEQQWKNIGEKLVSVLTVVSDKLKHDNAIQNYEVQREKT